MAKIESSRITPPPVESATGLAAEVFAQIRKSAGRVPNAYATIGTLHPEALQAMLAADAVLARGGLTARERELIKLLVSDAVGCDYCSAAHHMLSKMAGLTPVVLQPLREGKASGDVKLDALARFVDILVQTRGTIPAEAYSAIRAAGYSDAQLVDIALAITTITFTNIFNRINDTELDFPRVDDIARAA
jgi:uncharacterized peroxidase-related enzyme